MPIMQTVLSTEHVDSAHDAIAKISNFICFCRKWNGKAISRDTYLHLCLYQSFYVVYKLITSAFVNASCYIPLGGQALGTF